MGEHRSIKKVWDELQKILKEGRFTNMEGEEDAYTNEVNSEIEFLKASLRAELLEKCSQPITDGDGDDSTARNMSAAYAFWAWELEQRAIKAQKGGGA